MINRLIRILTGTLMILNISFLLIICSNYLILKINPIAFSTIEVILTSLKIQFISILKSFNTLQNQNARKTSFKSIAPKTVSGNQIFTNGESKIERGAFRCQRSYPNE